MKYKYNEGSSLIEVLVAIVILALIVVPTCTSLVMSSRINAKAEQLLQDQLAVSSAVETLMATGVKASEIDNNVGPNEPNYDTDRTDGVTIKVIYKDSYYEVTAQKGEVSVTTKIGGGA